MGNEITARTAIFKGLNRMPYIEDGELRSMKNLSSDAYPYLTTRKGREEHKIAVYVPGVPGDGYLMDVEELPEESLEYAEEIVKVVSNPAESTFVAGEYYNNISGEWVPGIDNVNFKGAVNEVDIYYRTDEFKKARYVYADKYYKGDYENHIYKYIGNANGIFEKGKTYQYKLHIEAYWEESDIIGKYDLGVIENINDIPEATELDANIKAYFYYSGKTTEKWSEASFYICYIRGYGYWEEIPDVYELTAEMTEKNDGVSVRYIGNYSGTNIPKAYYTCDIDYYNGNAVYFYLKSENYGGEYTDSTELPKASEETYGKTYYSGTEQDAFYICEWDEAEQDYKWKSTEKPIVEKLVPFEVLVTDHLGVGIIKIYEIGQLNGKIAVLFKDGSGNMRLYYEQKLFLTNDVSETPGKKLQTMGNKLIVGENGSYLYRDKETKELKLHYGSDEFSKTIYSDSIEYAPGKYKHSSIETAYYGEGEVKIILYSVPNDKELEALYKCLTPQSEEGEISKVNFSVKINENTFYLQTEECKYEQAKTIGGYFDGSQTRKTFADVLTINAKGMHETFSWNSEKRGAYISFESITSYLPDVAVWKKRLWGYKENYLQGTVQDVFDNEGEIDWVTGDNTYTESISQPIWQGGDITGLAALSEALVLFKEDSVTVFTGNYPAIMQASTIPSRGLLAKDRESVSVANEYVYYMSSDGVYRFGGGIPYCISKNAKITGTEAVGASNGNKYWLSIKEDNGQYGMYVFDINLGFWHKEDNTKAVSFVPIGGKMYMATETQIYKLDVKNEDIEWEAELWFDEGTHDFKKYKGFETRGNLGDCEIYLKADDGEWQAYAFTDNKLSIKAEPFWCRELGVKIKGKGNCEIKSLDRTYEVVDK